jgi:hypothetical protein
MAYNFTSPTGDYVKSDGGQERVVYHHPLNQKQFGSFYHGSTSDLKPGDMLTSSASRGAKVSHAKGSPAHHRNVFAGTEDYAADFAGDKHSGGGLYEVEPTGPVYNDPIDSGNHTDSPEAVMSHKPMRVKKKVF